MACHAACYQGDMPLLSSEQNWVLASYDVADPCNVVVVGEGTGGLTECLSHTTSDRVYWGGFRVVAVDKQRGVVSRRSLGHNAAHTAPHSLKARGIAFTPPWLSFHTSRPKHCFFMLAGEATPYRVKARGMLHMGAIAEVMQQSHVSFEVENADELEQGDIAAKLLQCGGAHKPNAWDFGGKEGMLQYDWY